MLETEARARARGARVYAYVEGYASTCDAYHRVQMYPEGTQIVRAMRLALDRSGRALEEIGYVSYHGTSTPLNDAVEVRCVRRVFGAQAERVPLQKDQKYTAIASPQTLQSLLGKLAEACPFEAVRPQSVCADCFEYTLSIEMDGVQYGIKATDADMPENLRPLIEELTAITQTTFSK